MTPIRVSRRDKPEAKGHIVSFVTDSRGSIFEVSAVVVLDDGSIFSTGLANLLVLVPIRG